MVTLLSASRAERLAKDKADTGAILGLRAARVVLLSPVCGSLRVNHGLAMADMPDTYRPLGGEPPVGWILAHNNVSPNAVRGFRAFWVPRDRKKWVVCPCGWQPELGEHYRPRRV